MLVRLMKAIVGANETDALQATIERMDYLDRFARSTLEHPVPSSPKIGKRVTASR
jgi:hypothetical protein